MLCWWKRGSYFCEHIVACQQGGVANDWPQQHLANKHWLLWKYLCISVSQFHHHMPHGQYSQWWLPWYIKIWLTPNRVAYAVFKQLHFFLKCITCMSQSTCRSMYKRIESAVSLQAESYISCSRMTFMNKIPCNLHLFWLLWSSAFP